MNERSFTYHALAEEYALVKRSAGVEFKGIRLRVGCSQSSVPGCCSLDDEGRTN